MSSLGHGSKRRDLPSWGHCRKEGRRPGAGGSFSCELGSCKPEGESDPGWGTSLVRSLSAGVKECRRTSPDWKIYVISFSSSLHFICNLLSFFPFVFLSKLIFALLLPISKCILLLSSIFYPFPTLFTISFLASLSISFFRLLFLSLWPWEVTLSFSPFCPAPWLFPCVPSLEEKDWYTYFTIKVVLRDGLDRKCH